MNSKLLMLAGVAIAAVLALIGATQVWVTLTLVEGAAAVDALAASGQELNPSLSPIAVAALAGALALTIAGPIFRRVLGVLIALLGAGIAAVGFGVLADASAAAASRLAEITAIAGDAQLSLVASSAVSIWPTVTIIAGVLLVLLGAAVVVLAGRWRAAGRKYQSGNDAGVAPRASADPDRISDWETLSGGGDPSEDASDGSDDTIRGNTTPRS